MADEVLRALLLVLILKYLVFLELFSLLLLLIITYLDELRLTIKRVLMVVDSSNFILILLHEAARP